MSESPILLDVADGIARLTLNRPDVGNAIDLALARSLLEAAIRCQTDDAIRCVVLTGRGRLFCAGGDVGQMAAAGERADALLSELAGTLHMSMVRLARMKKPLVVLVNGPAAGAGLSLAISGDVVLSVPTAHFTAAYGAIGLTPDGGMSWLLPRLVGLRKAQEIILANRRIEAPEAEAIGLVSRLVEADRLTEEGDAIATQFADAAVGAVGGARALLHHSFDSSYEAQLEREAQSIAEAGATAECREGLAAFFAKRKADFRSV
ncbi:enoyl-CoA hydratase/isomerase family protein [Flavisphingomonas formosensis]|uniref:enoyl-CoA hydratase/isomerase family protein n=1 Tax=Flavisphingomonas formosensis TaxID=861534 RepID=UPI0012FAFA65|nr:enoyl-CoA hydratase-related protein [Sphingomonas formosensis]